MPDGWVIGNVPVPFSGPIAWQGDHTGRGEFYAAALPDDDPIEAWHVGSGGAALQVKTVTDEAVEAAYAFLTGCGCAAPEDAGMTIAEVARDLGYLLPPGRAAVGTTWTLRASRRDGQEHWYAVHGTRARDRTTAEATRDGYQVTPPPQSPRQKHPQQRHPPEPAPWSPSPCRTDGTWPTSPEPGGTGHRP